MNCFTARKRSFIGLFMAASHIFAAASVADTENNNTRDDVEEVIIMGRSLSASNVALELQQFGNSVQVIGAEQIAAGGFVNFAELAQGLIRGANIGYSPDEGEYTIRLDGGGDRDTLVTLDGVPLYDRGPGVENIWGATLIDSRMIERVEVFRGGQSLYFGSNGGLGVVNIITKRPDGSIKGDGGLMYGSFNTREIWGNYSFPVSDDRNHSIMLYGSRYASDGHRIFARETMTSGMAEAGGISDYSSSKDNIGVKYYWKIDSSSELLLNMQYVQIDFQDTFPNNTIFGPVTSKMPLINLEYTKTWRDGLRTDAYVSYRNPTLYHNKFEPEMCRAAEGCINGRGQRIEQGDWMGTLRALSFRGVGDQSIKGGFEELQATVLNTVRINQSLSTVLGAQSLNYRDDSDPILRIDSKTVSTNGLFIDARITPVFSPATNISLASRIDFADSFGSEKIWKFGFRQGLPAGLYVRANGGTSFSLPQTNELYLNTETSRGNPDLKPERTKTFNGGFGLERSISGMSILAEVGGFHSDITNRIQTTTGITPAERFNNDAVTEIRGLTADLDFGLSSGWNLSLSYTKQDATLEGSDVQINSTPKWFATGTLRWASSDNTYHFSLMPRLQGPETVQGPAGLPELDYGSWFLLNGSIGYWAGEGKRHRTQLRFVNILNETYGERGAFGNQFNGREFIRGEYTNSSPEYFYPYIFQGKPRSVFVTYAYYLQ